MHLQFSKSIYVCIISFLVLTMLMLNSCDQSAPNLCFDEGQCVDFQGFFTSDGCKCQCYEGWTGYTCSYFVPSISATHYYLEIFEDLNNDGNYETLIDVGVYCDVMIEHDTILSIKKRDYGVGANQYVYTDLPYLKGATPLTIEGHITTSYVTNKEVYLFGNTTLDTDAETSLIELWETNLLTEKGYYYHLLRK